MFKIGDFSRLSNVSIKTLHHYDEIDLFKPMRVDKFTGYRYYTYDQLPHLNRILALRGLGFSLEQIKEMIGRDGKITITNEALRGMLTLRQAQLQQLVDETRQQLHQVEIRLRQLEQEGQMSQIEILTKEIGQVMVIGGREIVPDPSLMRERCMALNTLAWRTIQEAGLQTNGVSFALYYSDATNGIDVEMAYEVQSANLPELDGIVKAHILAPTRVAYAVYRGSYDDFGAVGRIHADVMNWIQINGYRQAGACREYYLRPPQRPNDPLGVMEIQYPITTK
jgi:DNA-binding transcriptional MerR regulator